MPRGKPAWHHEDYVQNQGEMSIDERLQVVTQNLELLSQDIHQMQDEMRRLDARERKGREALLAGIAAYLRTLQDNDNGDEEK